MSFVNAVPEFLGSAASDLAGIGSSIKASNVMAAAPTVAVSAAAGDQVSAAVASFFSGHAQGYQSISAQAANFHSQFVQALNAGTASYTSAEAANASPLQQPSGPTGSAPTGNGDNQTPTAATSRPSARPANAGRPPVRLGAGTPAVGSVGSGGVRGASSPEATTAATTASGGGGGLLLGPSVAGTPGGSWSTASGSGAGGVLSRLVSADAGGNKVGRISGGTGVGVLLTTPAESDTSRSPAVSGAGGSAKLQGLWASDRSDGLGNAGASGDSAQRERTRA